MAEMAPFTASASVSRDKWLVRSLLCSGFWVQRPLEGLGESRRCSHSDRRGSGPSNLTHRAAGRRSPRGNGRGAAGSASGLSLQGQPARRRLSSWLSPWVVQPEAGRYERGRCGFAQDTFRGNLCHVFSGVESSVAIWTDRASPMPVAFVSPGVGSGRLVLCRGESLGGAEQVGALPGVFVIKITGAQSETVSWSQAGPREGDSRRGRRMKEAALERSSGQSVCVFVSVCL